MGEIVRNEVDKMDANRELQTQLRYVHGSALASEVALHAQCGRLRHPWPSLLNFGSSWSGHQMIANVWDSLPGSGLKKRIFRGLKCCRVL